MPARGTDRALELGDQTEVRDPGAALKPGGVWYFRPVLEDGELLGEIVRDPQARYWWWPSRKAGGAATRRRLRVASWEKAARIVATLLIGRPQAPDIPIPGEIPAQN